MLKLSTNVSLLFGELPFLERFGAAAHAGFTAVEIMYPYDQPVAAIARSLRDHALTLSVINLPPRAGHRGT
jgi:hydroxypyruvate isomerase